MGVASGAARYDTILASARRESKRQGMLVAAVAAVCVIALTITGFFDARRFI